MREKRDWRKRKREPLTPERLARILRSNTTEQDAAETYEKLTGEKIPEKERRTDG